MATRQSEMLRELREEAESLIKYGISTEKPYAEGMLYVIEKIETLDEEQYRNTRRERPGPQMARERARRKGVRIPFAEQQQ